MQQLVWVLLLWDDILGVFSSEDGAKGYRQAFAKDHGVDECEFVVNSYGVMP